MPHVWENVLVLDSPSVFHRESIVNARFAALIILYLSLETNQTVVSLGWRSESYPRRVVDP